ncbi:hypothetical protein ACJMK2_033711 [Sinanodonta woodiana]|uniref:Uncharacterized protein n=1 Tax=Sinanodonta woodiana TaxID=1069815 RepID=A0ABD3WP78_SINWO
MTSLRRQLSSSIDLSKLKNQRARAGEQYLPTDVEQIANVITHALWIVPSLVGLFWMQNKSQSQAEIITTFVYGISLICLFTVSTIFHTVSFTKRSGVLKNFFHIGDRAVIYIFIASSYTPWLMLKDFGGAEITSMWIVWTMAILGILYQYIFHEQYKWLETLFYLIIGVCPAWCVMHMADPSGVFELALGGMTYITGVIFFKCDGIIPFAHAIWHCFVIMGAMFHFYAINTYLIGAKEVESSLGIFL